MLQVPVSTDLHRAAKAKAAEMGITLRELVATALASMVSKKEPKQ